LVDVADCGTIGQGDDGGYCWLLQCRLLAVP
jgi:hypothetical protein